MEEYSFIISVLLITCYSLYSLVSPEVAEVLGKYRKTYDLMPEPVADSDVAVKTSPVSEEAENCPSGMINFVLQFLGINILSLQANL